MGEPGPPPAGTPFWFGPTDRPLLGFFHGPADGTARAGAVICPPFDRDHMHAHYALRLLGEGLVDEGLAVVRFDYDGSGDSAGDAHDPGRVAAWHASVAAAIEALRSAGASSVVLVGMRIGATLAGMAAETDGDIAALVLWDPVASGRAYLTEQRALSALAFDGPTGRDDGSVETPGMVFSADTVHDMRSLDLAKTEGPLAERVLVLARSDRPNDRLATRLSLPHVEWEEATGQADLMDTGSPNQVLPKEAIARIAHWVGNAVPTSRTPFVRPSPAGGATVAHTPEGDAVVETPGFVGPAGLFGVVTEVIGKSAGPTVLFLNVANEPRVGPARLWVELARRWAANGVRSFRFDVSGLGDSPTRRPDQRRFVTRAPEAFDDVADTCRALRPDDPTDVVLVGLCASAYQVLDSAFEVRPRAVVSINPVLSFRPPELVVGEQVDPRRHVAIPRRAATQALHGNGPITGLRHRFPRLNAWARDRVEVAESLLASPKHRPAVWLSDLADMGVEVLVVCGEREARPISVSGSSRTFRRLERTGRFHLDLIAGLEHGLLVARDRDDVVARVSHFVASVMDGRPAADGDTAASLRDAAALR